MKKHLQLKQIQHTATPQPAQLLGQPESRKHLQPEHPQLTCAQPEHPQLTCALPKHPHPRTILLAALLALLTVTALLLSSCGSEEPVEKQLFAMDTTITISAYGDAADDAVQAAEQEILRLDGVLNAENPDSEIGKLNAKGNATLSEDSGALIQEGLRLYKDTSGLFDIAIHPIMQAWGFTTKKYRVPEKEELDALLAHIDADKIQYSEQDRKAAFKDAKMSVDLGGIAKGYTSGRIMKVFKDAGISSGLVNLGGNVHALGKKPDGSRWRIAVEDPDGKDYMGLIEVEDCAVITSGAYERNFQEKGKTYHHIIDPRTGYPADSGLKSVTIVSKDGTLADALSTSLFIMGKDNAIDYWRKHADSFDCILMSKDNKIFVTAPIADSFSSDQYEVEEIPLN